MKKKILLSIIALFVISIFTINVNAASGRYLSFPSSTKAKEPSTIPASGSTVYAVSSDEYQLKYGIFYDEDEKSLGYQSGEGNNVQNINIMQKIAVGTMKNSIKLENSDLDGIFSNWFTAYCLDGTKKYPQFGLLSVGSDSADPDLYVKFAIISAIMNNEDYVNSLKAYSPIYDFASITFTSSDSKDNSTLKNDIKALNTDINVTDIKIEVLNKNGIEEIGSNKLPNNGKLTFKGKDVLLDKYTVSNALNDSKYEHQLWILEHTYPTLSLEQALTQAGTSLAAVKTDLAAATALGSAPSDEDAEFYVYATIQYAIWKVSNTNLYGQLGNSITKVNSLDTLYKYLIKDRDEYKGYSKADYFDNSLSYVEPTNKDKPYKESKSSYTYGPYTVKYSSDYNGKLDISIVSPTKGVKIVDANGNTITGSNVNANGTFYVECSKAEKIANVKIKLTLKDTYTFANGADRGRIYYSTAKGNQSDGLLQNVISAGKITTQPISTNMDLIYNPKTGVENVAVLIMIALVAFSIGYLALSYKGKPVELGNN